MDPQIGLQVLGALGNLAGMLSTYFAFRSHRREIGSEEAKAILTAGQEQAASAASLQIGQQLVVIISRGLLDRAKENITHAERRFEGVITDVRYTPAQKDQEAEIARAEICSTLQLIKDHNDGELPDGELNRMWIQYRCAKDTDDRS